MTNEILIIDMWVMLRMSKMKFSLVDQSDIFTLSLAFTFAEVPLRNA